MSFEEGSAYVERLIRVSQGDTFDRSVPVECIVHDLWNDMRRLDKTLADELQEPVFSFWRAQTDGTRIKPMGLREYFIYRNNDLGQP